jgi:hypothetical protein
MFVRRKVNDRGAVFYHIVQNVRKEGKHQQIAVLALGPHSDPAEALAAWKAELSTLKQRRTKAASHEDPGMRERHELERVGRMIARLEDRITRLAGLIKRGEISDPV